MQIKVNDFYTLIPSQWVNYISVIKKDELSGSFVISTKSEHLKDVLNILKYSTFFGFPLLLDIVCTDDLSLTKRFELRYCLLSLKLNCRVEVVVTDVNEIDSVVEIFNSANWLEREIWDMYGVFFLNHPDLRRILTDYGFDGHPLRKDFPLSGFVEIRYDDEIKKILTEPVSLSQEFRYFDFVSPWEKE